jgi:hypothetical protein
MTYLCLQSLCATPVVSAVFNLLQFDAEIVFWEGKTREQQHQMEFLSQEADRVEVAARLSEEQVCQYACRNNHHQIEDAVS